MTDAERITLLEASLAEIRQQTEKQCAERLLNVARGCHDYGGGYSETRLIETYHHGIGTVIAALESAVQHPDAYQVRVLECIGARAAEGGTK